MERTKTITLKRKWRKSVGKFVNSRVPGNPDILICGNCREMFTDLGELLEHKRNYCKLRFTCKCHTFNGTAPSMYSKEKLSAKSALSTRWTKTLAPVRPAIEWRFNKGIARIPRLRFPPLRNFSIKIQLSSKFEDAAGFGILSYLPPFSRLLYLYRACSMRQV